MNPAEIAPHEEYIDHRGQVTSFLENPLVNRVNRRSCIRTVGFARSMWLVEMRASLGFPEMSLRVANTTLAEGRNQSGPSVRVGRQFFTSCAKSMSVPKCSSTAAGYTSNPSLVN